MLLTVALPAALTPGGEARVRVVHAAAGVRIGPAAGLIDFSVDLSAGAAHDCPPVSHYRLVVRETAWLRAVFAWPGLALEAGTPLALLSTEPDEPIDGSPARTARVTVASIVFHAEGWGGPA